MKEGKYEDRYPTRDEAVKLIEMLVRYGEEVESRNKDFDPEDEFYYDSLAAGWVAAQPDATPIMVRWASSLRYRVTQDGLRDPDKLLRRE